MLGQTGQAIVRGGVGGHDWQQAAFRGAKVDKSLERIPRVSRVLTLRIPRVHRLRVPRGSHSLSHLLIIASSLEGLCPPALDTLDIRPSLSPSVSPCGLLEQGTGLQVQGSRGIWGLYNGLGFRV